MYLSQQFSAMFKSIAVKLSCFTVMANQDGCNFQIPEEDNINFIIHSDGSNINVDDEQSMTLKVHWIQVDTD